MPNTNGLVGLFFIENSPDHDGFRTGQIKAALNNGYLILPDNFNDAPLRPMEIISNEEMASELDCGCKRWSFFNSRRDLDRFMDWANTPDADAPAKKDDNKVVRLTKH